MGVVDHYDSLPGLGEAGAGAGGAGSGRSVYAGVLTSRDRLSDHSAVVRMTWGSELTTVQFFYDTGGERADRVRRDSELTTVQFFYDTGGERADRVRRDHTREVVGLSGKLSVLPYFSFYCLLMKGGLILLSAGKCN